MVFAIPLPCDHVPPRARFFHPPPSSIISYMKRPIRFGGSPNRIHDRRMRRRRICMRSAPVHFPTVSYLFIEEVSVLWRSLALSLSDDDDQRSLSLALSNCRQWIPKHATPKSSATVIGRLDEKLFSRRRWLGLPTPRIAADCDRVSSVAQDTARYTCFRAHC